MSNAPFTEEVVSLTSPKKGDVMTSRSSLEITWQTKAKAAAVTSTKLFYSKDGGTTWISITPPLDGDPKRFLWHVPIVVTPRAQCRIKVVLRDANGKTIGTGASDGCFTIRP